MHTLRSSSVATLAKAVCKLSPRLKSTAGRPSAPLGSRFLTNPDDVFKHNMWSVMCISVLIRHLAVYVFYGDGICICAVYKS